MSDHMNLPGGSVTTDPAEYLAAWSALADPIRLAFRVDLYSYDPALTFIDPGSSDNLRVSVALARRFRDWAAGLVPRTELEEANDIIQWLLDLQNGCPLPSYEEQWNEQRARAVAFLAKHAEAPDA